MKKSNFGKFLLLWIGEFISSIGGGLSSFGLGVYVFNMTGRATDMALVTLIAFLPGLFLSVPAGVLADRFDRRLLMMIGDGLSAVGIIFILICMQNGGASLLQICIGVGISSVFSALLEPSFRATITDLLTTEEYSKASGLVSLAGSVRYLLSPIIAGALLTFSDIRLLLVIDICTFFLTITAAATVRKSISVKKEKAAGAFLYALKEGWKALAANKGVLILIIVSSFISLFIGMFQILAEPMILTSSDAATLGTAETICASGMLVSSIIIGIKGIKSGFVRKLSISLALSGVFMTGFSLTEYIVVVCIFGFLFFASLPVANNCLDFLVRTNIPDNLQGRVWGIIGFISQLGYVAAYGLSGIAADAIGELTGSGVGKGSSIVIAWAGIFLAVSALSIMMIKSVRKLEIKQNNAAHIKV